MLDSFRKASQSWFIKILFGMLILSFSVWGIGDVIRMRAESTPAIVVGSQEITATEVAEEFRRDTEQLSQAFGGKLTTEQARQLGLLQRTIQQMISQALLDQAADQLKLGLDDETLRKMIANTAAFQNEFHVFDKAAYQRALVRAGLTEKQFVTLERRDMARQQVVQLVGGGMKTPAVMAEVLFRYRNEQRVAETVMFQADKMPAPAKADEAALNGYYKDHSAQFMAPEMRGITATVIRAADVAGDIKPSDADIEKSYQVRLAEFQSPDKRNVQQVLFDDKAKAQAFADAVAQGKDFAAAAKQAGQTVQELGWVDRKDVPLDELANAIFGATTTGVIGPVQTMLGWHVVRITALVPGKTRPLSDVRSQIVQDLVRDEATNRLYAASTRLEDSIGSGAGVEEAASALGLKPLKVSAMDEHGNGPDGKPAEGVPLTPEFLGLAFQTPQGSTSDVTGFKDGSGYFVLHVDQVAAPALKPFDQVKDQVIAAWTKDQRDQAARHQAETAAERMKKGESLAAVAGSFPIVTTKPFRRAGGEDAAVPPALAAEMFKQPATGEVAVVAAQGGTMLARLKTIIAADPVAEKGLYDKTRGQLDEAMSNDLLQQYLASLQTDLGVHVNNAVIDQQFQK